MAKNPMVQFPRPSTKPGKPGGPAVNNPPKPKPQKKLGVVKPPTNFLNK